jgi:hypothetical protein
MFSSGFADLSLSLFLFLRSQLRDLLSEPLIAFLAACLVTSTFDSRQISTLSQSEGRAPAAARIACLLGL